MNARRLQIVVLDARPGPPDGVTEAIATALANEPGINTARASEAPAVAAASEAHARLHQADAAVALDSASLERARDAGIPLCGVVFPAFDLAWAEDLGRADLILVAHPSLADALVARGVSRAALEVVGPVAPAGWTPASDRLVVRAEVGLPHSGLVVVVPAAVIDEEGPTSLLVQLGLVGGATFLFDVGQDIETAETLRRVAPAHGISGYLFAQSSETPRYWQAADMAIARSRGGEISRALAVGAPVLLLPSGRTDEVAAASLAATGAAVRAESMATLAVSLEQALEPSALHAARAAVSALDAPGTAERIAHVVRQGWEQRRDAGQLLPRGLPSGLEKLPDRPLARPSTHPGADGRDLDERIEAELKALKKKILIAASRPWGAWMEPHHGAMPWRPRAGAMGTVCYGSRP